MRIYNNRPVELLAPCGNFQIAKAVLEAKCDAIYLGGKSFNMRMHSELMNFTFEEIKKTVELAHSIGKKVYITVNSLIEDEQIEAITEYLKQLKSINVDALIVQDYSIIKILKDNNIDIDLHASVMMNIHNDEQVRFLEKNGFTRFVASRILSLDYVKNMDTDLEIEYFVSGDMCTVGDALCHYSGVLLNRSSNKGSCFKPCRWNYDIGYKGELYENKYHLAAKDVNLINHIEELCNSNVTSFKIEGRRKQLDELISIINSFGNALDDFLENKPKQDYAKDILEVYPRDTSTSFAFGNPGLDYINSKNENNPEKLRIFSTATSEVTLNTNTINAVKEKLKKDKPNVKNEYKISVKVENIPQALVAIKNNVDILYLAMESYNSSGFTVAEVNEITSKKQCTKVVLGLPTYNLNENLDSINNFISSCKNLDGLQVTNIGQVYKYANKYQIYTDYTLNTNNTYTMDFFQDMNVNTSTLSIEATEKQGKHMLNHSTCKELISYGHLSVMILDIDLYKNIVPNKKSGKTYNHNIFDENILLLIDNKNNQHPIVKDNYGFCHMLTTNKVNLLPIIEDLKANNTNIFRIEGQMESPENLDIVIKEFQKALKSNYNYENNNLPPNNTGYFLGALNHTKELKVHVITK